MNETVLRHAENIDYDAVINVVDEWWGGRQMAQMLPRLFFAHFRPTSFVAEHEGNIVAFITGFVSQSHPEEAYIHFVGVHPDYRKHGLGRTLYEKFFSAVALSGCTLVRCVTSPINRASIAFHIGQGFIPEASVSISDGIPFVAGYDGPGEDRVLFSKKLSTSSR